MLHATLSFVILLGSAPSIFCVTSTTEMLDLSIFDDWLPSTKSPALNTPDLRPFVIHKSTPFVESSRSSSPFYGSDTSPYAFPLPQLHGLGYSPSNELMQTNPAPSAPSTPFFAPSYFSSLMPQNWPAPASVVSHSPQQSQRAIKFPAANGLPTSFYPPLPPVSLSPLQPYQGNSHNPLTPFISDSPQSVLPEPGLQPIDSMNTNHITASNDYAYLNPVTSFSVRSNAPHVYSQPVTSSAPYLPPAYSPGPIVATFIRSYDLPLVPLGPSSMLSVDDRPANYFLSYTPLVQPQSGVSHQSPLDSTAARTYDSFSMQPHTPTAPLYPYNPFSMTYHGSHASSTNYLPSSFSNYRQNPAINNHPTYYHQ